MIRKLYLMNDQGLIYYFDYHTSTLITSLDGLGFEHELSYLKYENTYDCVDRTFPLGQLKANLIFLKGYNGYSDFLSYLKSSKILRLVYINDSTKWCDVEIKSLSKGELVSGTIQSTIIFDKLSLWLKEISYEITVNTDDRGKVYPYQYPYFYTASYLGKIKIKNNGAVKAPLKVEIYGEVSNPEIRILKEGITVSTLKLYVISSDCNITVSSIVTNQYIKMKANGIESNIYQHQDFTCDNFLFLNTGEYEVEFKPGVNSKTTCIITVTEGYLG